MYPKTNTLSAFAETHGLIPILQLTAKGFAVPLSRG